MRELINQCKALNRNSQRKMVDHLTSFLFPICLRYSKTKEDAQDLMQEALIKIFNSLDSFNSDNLQSFKAWCKRITINLALASFRKNSIILESINDMQKDIVGDAPKVFSHLNVQDIMKLLNQLPTNYKYIFNLAIIDDYDHKTISKMLDIKESHSRTLLTRARKKLQLLVVEQNNHSHIKVAFKNI